MASNIMLNIASPCCWHAVCWMQGLYSNTSWGKVHVEPNSTPRCQAYLGFLRGLCLRAVGLQAEKHLCCLTCLAQH